VSANGGFHWRRLGAESSGYPDPPTRTCQNATLSTYCFEGPAYAKYKSAAVYFKGSLLVLGGIDRSLENGEERASADVFAFDLDLQVAPAVPTLEYPCEWGKEYGHCTSAVNYTDLGPGSCVGVTNLGGPVCPQTQEECENRCTGTFGCRGFSVNTDTRCCQLHSTQPTRVSFDSLSFPDFRFGMFYSEPTGADGTRCCGCFAQVEPPDRDPIFASLCPASCLHLEPFKVAEQEFRAQFETTSTAPMASLLTESFFRTSWEILVDTHGVTVGLYDTWRASSTLVIPPTHCGADNNFAAYEYLRQDGSSGLPYRAGSFPTQVSTTCSELAALGYAPANPCGASNVIRALCPAACGPNGTYAALAGSNCPQSDAIWSVDACEAAAGRLGYTWDGSVIYSDADKPAGCFYSGTTVALNTVQSKGVHKEQNIFPAEGGNVPGGVCSKFANGDQAIVSYRPYASAAGVWSTVLRTFPLDAELPSVPAGGSEWTVSSDVPSVTGGSSGDCYGSPLEAGVHYDLATTNDLYGMTPSLAGVVVEPVCHKDSRCPLATTCVLSERRFEDELSLVRGDLPRSAFLSEAPIERRHAILHA
jgi:hypothetical protein